MQTILQNKLYHSEKQCAIVILKEKHPLGERMVATGGGFCYNKKNTKGGERMHTKEEYIARRGPINHMTPSTREEYAWLDDPWPWELCANKEV